MTDIAPQPAPVVVSPSLANVASIPHLIANYVSSLVELTHKQAAAIWGILAAAGVVGVPAGAKTGSAILLGYAALCHIAERLLKV
jgi:hypothetical protein